MLKLLNNILARVTDRDRGPCVDDWTRETCEPCQHINRWMPRVTSFSPTGESRLAVLVRTILEVDEELLCAICDPCFHPDVIADDLTWLDQLTGQCLCIVGNRMGFPCDICLPTPVLSLCGGKRYTYEECEIGPNAGTGLVLRSYIFNSEQSSACTVSCDGNPEQFIFDVENDPQFYRNILKAFYFSKTASGNVDSLITALELMFPGENVRAVDTTFGRAWFTIGRALSDFERRLRPLLADLLPIAPGISFRLLEPECENAL